MQQSLSAIVLWALGFLLFCAGFPAQAAQGTIRFNNGRLSLDVQQEPFFAVLQKISEQTGVRFFVSEDITPGRIDTFVNRKPLQEGLRKLLTNHNYAMIFSKSDQGWQVASVEIYPRGHQDGVLHPIPVQDKVLHLADGKTGKRVLVTSTSDMVTYGRIEDHGLLQPSRTIAAKPEKARQHMNEDWFVTQKQLEVQEQEAYQELIYAKNRLDAVADPDRKAALQAAYNARLNQFYRQKESNTNRIEAIKRIGIFRKMSQPEQ